MGNFQFWGLVGTIWQVAAVMSPLDRGKGPMAIGLTCWLIAVICYMSVGN